MESLRVMNRLGIFIEVTTLLIPGLNDDTKELEELTAFIVQDLGRDTPWHVSRFHPTYQLTDRPATPVETVHKARKIGLKAGLRYVYAGNIPGDEGESTRCYNCGRLLIQRWGFRVSANHVIDGKCPGCGVTVHGLW
jgi:pyruvate formate lyase activating enzyme